MVRLIAVACVLALCLQVSLSQTARFADADYQAGFLDWMRTFVRSYSASEWATKFATFKRNMDFVAETNSRNLSYKVELNIFGDLSLDEFKNLQLLAPSSRARDTEEVEIFTGEGVRIPRANVNWTASGAVSAIKDQGQCGSCWTFGAAGAIESALKIAGGPLVQLSEQNLLDCTSTQYSCNGGSPIGAFQYVISNKGINTMASYAYQAAQGSCRYNAANSGATITGYSRVTANDESALAAAVSRQPVTVAIQGDLQSFQFYKSGIYSNSSCTSAKLNHAVIAVGYGTDSATGKDYWLLRNSWGTRWGQYGYVQMARGINMCGVAADASFPTGAASPSTTSGSSSTTAAPATTGSATTGSATTGSATTGGSTTGSSRSPAVFIDALASGWQVGASGTVNNINVAAIGYSGYGVSANVSGSSALMFYSNTPLSVSGLSSFKFWIKTSSTAVIAYGVSTSLSQTTSSTSTWRSVTAAMSSMGSPSSVQYAVFYNTGSTPVVVTVDTVTFA